jgi:polyphenol oxidase
MRNIRYGFEIIQKNGLKYLTIPSFEEAGGVICAFSTRVGGVSPIPFDTLNFSKKREGSEKNFFENLSRFGEAVGFNYKEAVAINYAHSPDLYHAAADDAGRGVIKENVPIFCDGLYTDAIRLPIISFHADCVPLFFYDPVSRAIAVCHAGWRGIVAHMAKNAIGSLISLGSRESDILAAVGPCISSEYYEVGKDVADVFINEFGKESAEYRNNGIFLELAGACAADIMNCGISPDHITVSGLCTYKEKELFFSHRRDKGETGSMAAVMQLIDR